MHWIKVDENVIFVIPTFLFVPREKQQGTLGSVTVLPGEQLTAASTTVWGGRRWKEKRNTPTVKIP